MFASLWVAATAAASLLAVAPDETVSVVDEGPQDGRAVVFVPGLSGCAYSFRKVTPPLHEQELRTVIIEPLGLGLSDRTSGADYTLTAQAARLATVLDALGVKGAVFVSQGVATSMVLRLALRRPDLVAGIVSIEGGAAESAATPTLCSNLKLTRMVARLGGDRILRTRYAENLEKASGDASWIDRRAVAHYFRGPQRDLTGTIDALRAMAEQPEPAALGPRLGEITIPVHVLCGTAEHSGALDADEMKFLTRNLSGIRFQDVPGAGHFIQEEQPQAVVTAVAALLADTQ